VYNKAGNRVQDSGIGRADWFCAGAYFRKGLYKLSNAPENDLNLFGIKSYKPPMGDGYLQKRSDLPRITLNLPLFSKTSLVTSHVYSVQRLFKRPYPVRDCPENPPTSYIYKCHQPPKRSVKTRRKLLVSNKVYLQIGDADLLTTETQRTQRNAFNNFNKGKEKRAFVYKVAVPQVAALPVQQAEDSVSGC
jgi:hypothetical protein